MKQKLVYLSLMVAAFNTQLYANTYCVNENKAIPFDNLNSDFTIHGDGTVTHKKTALVWTQCSLGQSPENGHCVGEASQFNWQEALNAATTNYFGYSDWRLPNLNELQSILENRCWSPSINHTAFPATPSTRFWTATPGLNEATGGSPTFHFVDFAEGQIGGFSPNIKINVRLVRDISEQP